MPKKVIKPKTKSNPISDKKRLKRVKIGVIAVVITAVLSCGSYIGYSAITSKNNTNTIGGGANLITKSLGVAASDNDDNVLGASDPDDPWHGFYEWIQGFLKLILFWWKSTPNTTKIARLAKDYAVNKRVPNYDKNDSNTWGNILKGAADSDYQDMAPDYFTDNGQDASEDAGSWSDCGMFVSFIMRGGLIDKEYPVSPVAAQYDYVVANTNLYDIISIQTPDKINLIKKGDIIIIDKEHTLIAGAASGTIVYQASAGDHVPDTRTSMDWIWTAYPASRARIIARKK